MYVVCAEEGFVTVATRAIAYSEEPFVGPVIRTSGTGTLTLRVTLEVAVCQLKRPVAVTIAKYVPAPSVLLRTVNVEPFACRTVAPDALVNLQEKCNEVPNANSEQFLPLGTL